MRVKNKYNEKLDLSLLNLPKPTKTYEEIIYITHKNEYFRRNGIDNL